MTVRVLIDARALVGERTGIGVHTAEIASRLGADVVPLLASHAPIEDIEGIENVERRVDRAPSGVLWQQMLLPRIAGEENASVVWGPHATLPVRLKRPAVVTLHDLTSITMPHTHRLKTIASFNPFIHRSLEQASKIISVSKFSADAAIRGFAVDPGKIEVIPNGVSDFFSPGGEPEDGRGSSPGSQGAPAPGRASGENYILYVGTLEPRKGVVDLIEAWEKLPKRPRLVLAGSSGWRTSALRKRIHRAAESGTIEVTGFIARERLRELYRGATLFVYPSHFEGFGLPVLEAMACGTPVITTTGGALPEAAGDAAKLVEPHDPAALASAMREILASPDERLQMTGLGLEHVKRFSWQDVAHRMSEIFREVAEKRS